uniref:NOP protein chaperone 1 n=1 Tax=Labrus bergylta TaxID=56723 RepID=A0A3Q3GVV4_9LABR
MQTGPSFSLSMPACVCLTRSHYFDAHKPRPSQRCDDVFLCASVLERLQSFLPQMAEANEKLKQQMEDAPAGCFDIESVEEAERVIEMDVALVELSGSEGDSEEDGEETSDSDSDEDSDEEIAITEPNFKFPGDKGKKKKANIQVVDSKGK